MTNRLELHNLCRRRLGDLTTPAGWSDLQINQWINDAIAEYSVHFPRQLNTTITTAASSRVYDLPAGFQSIVSVEYPTGEDPPEYLQRMKYQHPDFWQHDGYYDFIKRDASDSSQLLISEKPSLGETITIEYMGDHGFPAEDSDVITVPDRNLELLVLFVRWASILELASQEAKNPDPTTLNINTLELNQFRAERAYKSKLEEIKIREGESGSVTWRMDENDQIY
jgi:hypothetical protein